MILERVKECHDLREEIKTLEDKLNELQKKGDERKAELLKQVNEDELLNSLKGEFKAISDAHAKAVTNFAMKTDLMLTEFGGENV